VTARLWNVVESRQREGGKSSVTETAGKVENVWENRALKLIIATLVFPILVLVFHMLLMVPAIFLDLLLTNFAGHPEFWGKTLPVVALLPSCWGAIVVCKWIWPRSKMPTAAK
jgi:hypothetical protein